MPFKLEEFSRKAVLDLSTSISTAVARLMEGAIMTGPGGIGTIKLARVFADWPSYEDLQQSPAGCVLPDAPLVYDEAYPTPWLLEETWEPAGFPGFGVWVLSEAARDVEVQVRAGTAEERDAIIAGTEELFFRQEMTALAAGASARYGRIALMPEYYNLPVRVSLAESRKLDSEDSAIRNVWEVVFTLRAQARHVAVRPVRPFRVNVREVVTTDPLT